MPSRPSALPSKAIRLTVTLRNNRLLTLRQAHGLTQQQLAEALGITAGTISALENFCTAPHGQRFTQPALQHAVLRLAEFFAVPVVELAPPDLYEAIQVSRVERDVDAEDAMAYVEANLDDLEQLGAPTSDDGGIAAVERDARGTLREHLDAVLCAMTPIEAHILRRYYGIGEQERSTMKEIGTQFQVSRARIYQIIKKALCKLRHPKHSGALEHFVD